MHGISPRYKITKLRPVSNSVKIGKNITLNLNATQKAEVKPIKYDSVTPKQASSRTNSDKPLQFPEKVSMNISLNASSLANKLNSNFNRSYGNISREEVKSARPRKKISIPNTRR